MYSIQSLFLPTGMLPNVSRLCNGSYQWLSAFSLPLVVFNAYYNRHHANSSEWMVCYTVHSLGGAMWQLATNWLETVIYQLAMPVQCVIGLAQLISLRVKFFFGATRGSNCLSAVYSSIVKYFTIVLWLFRLAMRNVERNGRIFVANSMRGTAANTLHNLNTTLSLKIASVHLEC